MSKISATGTEAITTFAAATNSASNNLHAQPNGSKGWSCFATVTDQTPAGETFATTDVNTTSDVITKTAHGFVTGIKVQFTTTTTLPAGLSLSTDYFLTVLTADTFTVATSLVAAQAGTKINITDQGTGTHTVTAVALAGCTCKVQLSPDGTIWADKASSSQNITATTTLFFSDIDPMYRYWRLAFAITAGQVSASVAKIQKQ